MPGLSDGTDYGSHVALGWVVLMYLLLASLLCASRFAAFMPSPLGALRSADMSVVDHDGSVQCSHTSDIGTAAQP